MQYVEAVSIQPDVKQVAVADSSEITAIEQQNRTLMQLLAANQQLVALRDVQEVTVQLLAHITRLLDVRQIALWDWTDDEQTSLYCRTASTHELFEAHQHLRFSIGAGLVGTVARLNESRIISHADTGRDAIGSHLGQFQFQHMLLIPLSVNDSLQGLLEILYTAPIVAESDMHLVESLADSAAVALQSARLIDKLRAQNGELTLHNSELDAFAHTVAHDLRTPLNWVNGYIELLIKDWTTIDDGERLNYANAAYQGAQIMSNIIDELLLLASLNDKDIQFNCVDMGDVLNRARQRLEPMLHEYRANLALPTEYPTVCGYGPWIEGVWVNYISNAIKYGGSPPDIEVGFANDGDMVQFWVQDNGQGLSPDQQAELFAPLTGSGRHRGKGHGLGLSIVRRIVNRLGGEVRVESELFRGSRFIFTLPSMD